MHPQLEWARAARMARSARHLATPVVLAVLALALGAGAAPAASTDWELARDEGGVSVYTRSQEGFEYLAFRGVVTVPYSVDEVVAVLDDIESYPGWYARCESARTVERRPDQWRIVHMKIDVPFPVTDRDAVVRVQRERQGERVVTTIRSASDAVPEQSGYVRMARIEGSWTLEPDPAGGTRIVYEQVNDPSGSLPGWLANMMVTGQPLDTLNGLRATLAERSVSSQ